MKTRNIPALLMSLIFFIAPASFADDPAGSAELSVPSAGDDFNPHGYYTFQPDLRKCAAPLCGGYFVKAVNSKLTRCADGSLQESCYVAVINNKQNIDLSSAALLHGRIKTKIYPGFGNLGAFQLKAAFSSATSAVGEGSFVGLENNGIVCITTPCFSVDQSVLNSNKSRTISGIDLNGFGASDKDIDQAVAIMADGGVLIAAGVNKQVEEVAGPGVTFVASQVYFPIEATVK